MEPRKNPNIQYTSLKRSLFLNIGLCISLTLVIMAFEWKTYEPFGVIDIGQDNIFDEQPEVFITKQPQPEPPRPKIVNPVIIESTEEIEPPIADIEFPGIDDEPVIEFEPEKLEAEPDFFEGAVESMPEPVGGYAAFYKFVGDHVKYPKEAQSQGVEGRVFVRFIVDQDGSITNVESLREIGFGLDEEAIRVMNMAPKWIPGKQRGKAVKVRMVIPIAFRLSR